MTTTLLVITVAAMLYTLLGCVAFIAIYRPVWPWHHGVYGRNLLMLCWWLALWILVALAHAAVPMPLQVALGMQLVAFLGVGTVVWQRVGLVPRARREAAEPCPACSTPAVDQAGGERTVALPLRCRLLRAWCYRNHPHHR